MINVKELKNLMHNLLSIPDLSFKFNFSRIYRFFEILLLN